MPDPLFDFLFVGVFAHEAWYWLNSKRNISRSILESLSSGTFEGCFESVDPDHVEAVPHIDSVASNRHTCDGYGR